MRLPAAGMVPRYFDGAGVAIRLATRIASGGEGAIHKILGDHSNLAELYHRQAAARLPKLRSMLQRPPEDPYRNRTGHVSFCWPRRLVLDEVGCCAGFVMPRLDHPTRQPMAMYWNASRITWWT